MRGLILFFLLPVGLVAGLFFLVTDDRPSLDRPAMVSLADMEKGKAIVDSLGLRRMQEGEARQLVLSEKDLDRGVNYLAARLAKGSASASIALSQLMIRASLPLPMIHRYLNVELALTPQGDLLLPADMRLGALPVPAAVSGDLLAFALALSPFSEELAAGRDLLDSAQLTAEGLALRFTWRGAAVERALAGVAGQGLSQETLDAYRAHLGQVGGKDFPALLGAAFALAIQRSESNDPAAENRAALNTLAEIALGGRLLSRRGLANPNRHTGMRLAGREDFAQHFSLSAFISATGGAGISDLAGLYKELKDSQGGGSGFSFTDLAADRAGTRLGELATRSPESARKVQSRLAGTKDASLYFPSVADLPEFMDQAEFQRRFGGVGQPAYTRMVKQIEGRIGGLGLYRE